MTRILFPTDFSAYADHAFGFALQLARRLGAEITFLHAYNLAASADMMAPKEIIHALRAEEEIRALEHLQAYQARMQTEEEIPITPVLRTGYPAEAIIAMAEEVNPDLIIMGTKGATHQLDTFLGSVTSQVIQEVRVPVLAVPSEAPEASIERIGLATDLKQESSINLARLGTIARALGAEVHCIHVTDKAGKSAPEDVSGLERHFRQQMAYDRVHLHLRYDSQVATALEQFIQEQQINMLVVTTHRRSLLQRLLHKSLTRQLALEGRIPLLAFHDP
ncbi:MAG: universal stress protein [Bacteroidetes bacterium]|nr:MAG: universal stress protein [Bacteroidota bacterium]